MSPADAGAKGFTIRQDFWGVPDHPRLDGKRLQDLLYPEKLRTAKDRKAATEDAARLFKKPFFAAQLRYYGIPFSSSGPVARCDASWRMPWRVASVGKRIQGLEQVQKAPASKKAAGPKTTAPAKEKAPAKRKRQSSVDEGKSNKKVLADTPRARQTARKSASLGGSDNDKKRLAGSGHAKQTARKSAGGSRTFGTSARQGVESRDPSCVGSYQVTCKAVSEEWDYSNFSIDIWPGSNRTTTWRTSIWSVAKSYDGNGRHIPKASSSTANDNKPLRYSLALRGRETGTGEIYSDPEYGHIKFTDNTFTQFTGTVDLPVAGVTAKMVGFQSLSAPMRSASEWDAFSDEAAEGALTVELRYITGPKIYSRIKN
ncbi:unnamed protein product [Parascedosporium putredinis]|uniref:Uncharacterized protein n=1 Tax=Parascedosporium putredinis TaxID=1442378 RepID=A0A9P1MAA8_9PEZI|nr:unnamed protein product [Parascedosporium putredinis]CAI7992413.1 unnamed protein product [Parascedosporium putredinis]